MRGGGARAPVTAGHDHTAGGRAPTWRVSGPPLAFLDANVLFSAALGGPGFELLLGLAGRQRIRPVTSGSCVVEAETNLERKRPDWREACPRSSTASRSRPQTRRPTSSPPGRRGLVHADDVHVLAAARDAGADVLLTGDTTHFGALMGRNDLGLRMRTPRAFLLEGPESNGSPRHRRRG